MQKTINPQSVKEALINSKSIAEGNRIDKVGELCEKFGGKPRDWSKKKGWDRNGQEWHWYENGNGQKVGWKPAGARDPF